MSQGSDVKAAREMAVWTTHRFPVPGTASFRDELATIACARCGLKLTFNRTTARTIPEGVVALIPTCDEALVADVLLS